jgi:hypothetical protein
MFKSSGPDMKRVSVLAGMMTPTVPTARPAHPGVPLTERANTTTPSVEQFDAAWSGTAQPGDHTDDPVGRVGPQIDGLALVLPARQTASETAVSRRVGDLVLAGHTLRDARRLAPMAADCPPAPLTPREVAAAKLRHIADVARHKGAQSAVAWRLGLERAREERIAAADDPVAAAAREQADEEQFYRDHERHRRLTEAGADAIYDMDVYVPGLFMHPPSGF